MSSPIKIKINDNPSTKAVLLVAGRTGIYMGRTGNNMFKLKVDGIDYNFKRSDIELNPQLEERIAKHDGKVYKTPITQTKKLSPSTIDAVIKANELYKTHSEKVINELCIIHNRAKRQTKSHTSTSRRRSVKKECKEGERLNSLGNCVKITPPKHYRNPLTQRFKLLRPGVEGHTPDGYPIGLRRRSRSRSRSPSPLRSRSHSRSPKPAPPLPSSLPPLPPLPSSLLKINNEGEVPKLKEEEEEILIE